MTHQIHTDSPHYRLDPIEDHVAGDSIIFGPYTVTEDDESRDLTNDTIEWYLFDTEHQSSPDDARISHEDGGVHIEDPADGGGREDGRVQIYVEQGVTDGHAGEKHFRVIIDPPDESRQTFKGRIDIEP